MRMKNVLGKLKKKLLKRGGITFAELLFSVLILMLSTTIIIQCFNLGLGNVVKETRASEAQLLCSALTSSIQNELTYARDITITDGKLDTYFSSSRRMGTDSRLILVNGELKIQSGSDIYPLVAGANYYADNRAGVNSSGYFLKAYLRDGSIQWDSTNEVFKVTLWVDDATKSELTADAAKTGALAYSEFSVKPLAGVK
jgi:hypothetical protein